MSPNEPNLNHLVQLLDIHGVDLLAQAEAVLRSVREYRSGVLRLRTAAGNHESGELRLEEIRTSVKHVENACSQLRSAVEDVRKLVNSSVL